LIVDLDGMVQFSNPMANHIFKQKRGMMIDQPFGIPDCSGEKTEIDIYRTDHSSGVGEMYVMNTKWQDEPAYLVSIRDITERQKAEEKIKASLREKELLLKEIHHRVKNNLAVISSLLSMQSREAKESETQILLKESQNRIKSMALIHEKLYKTEDLSKIDFGDYIQSLADHLLETYRLDLSFINTEVKAENIFFGIDTAIPLGLMINELISNCFKHAFVDQAQARICITMHKYNSEFFKLIVKDNGVGFPEKFDINQQKSLGMTIIKALVEQLRGEIKVINNQGTEVQVKFTARRNQE